MFNLAQELPENFKTAVRIFLRRSLPFALTVLLTCCASTNNRIPESDLHSLLKIVEKKAYVVGQFQADFHKIRKSNLFQHEARVNGRLIFQKPGRFQLNLTGDVHLEIMSDGEFVALIHDNRDLEFFRIQGERDLSKFADPMMLLVNSLSNGDTTRFANMRQNKQEDLTVLEIEPGDLTEFEAIEKVRVKFSGQGTIQLIEMFFHNGNVERTLFDSWSLLAQDDPKIRTMNERIEKLSAMAGSNLTRNTYQLETDESLLADPVTDPPVRKPLSAPLSSKLELRRNSALPTNELTVQSRLGSLEPGGLR